MARSNWRICVVSIKLYIRNGAGDGVWGVQARRGGHKECSSSFLLLVAAS